MSVKGVIHRYFTIVEVVRNSKSISPRDLLIKLIDNGFEITQRTLQRDIEALRDELGIELAKDSKRNYILIKDEDGELARTIEVLGKLAISGHLEDLLRNKNIKDKIHFSSPTDFKGAAHIGEILYAISNNQKLKVSHKKFDSDNPWKVIICPYLLKEYQGRWYVSAWVDRLKELRTFGIDRIEDLKILPDKFTREVEPSELFDRTMGVVYSSEPERIVLSYTPEQGKYIKTLPLHSSQILDFENEDECRFSLFVSPNYELTQRILMDGANVKVISPKWLVDEIKTIVKQIVKKYN